MEKPVKRKPTRLTGHDYSQGGVYFLTICAKNREAVFGRIHVPDGSVGGGVLDAPQNALSEYGIAVERQLHEMAGAYGYISLLKYVIMPNHIHLLVHLQNGPSGTPAPTHAQRANQAIPAFVSTLKRMTNKHCGRDLWQRGYYDHIVRNDTDHLRIWQYIETNPAKWSEDQYYTR